MFSIDIIHRNGTQETITKVSKYVPFCDGKMIKVEIFGAPNALLIPSAQVIRIGREVAT